MPALARVFPESRGTGPSFPSARPGPVHVAQVPPASGNPFSEAATCLSGLEPCRMKGREARLARKRVKVNGQNEVAARCSSVLFQGESFSFLFIVIVLSGFRKMMW